jgi:hypothetical protein
MARDHEMTAAGELFHLPVPAPGVGRVQLAAAAMLDRMVADGILDTDYDGLLIAHVCALASRLDNPNERAYGLSQVSKELREVYRDLAARREAAKPAAPDPLAGLLDDE